MPAIEALEVLSVSESARKSELETIIKTGIEQTQKMLVALAEIRQDRLHRDTHLRFEDYVRDVFGKSRAYAFRMAAAGDVLLNLIDAGFGADALPANECVIKELTSLAPQQQREAWSEMLEDKGPEEVTAPALSKVITKITPSVDAVVVVETSDDDLARLNGSEGKVVSVNNSKSILQVEINGEKIPLMPGEVRVVQPAPVTDVVQLSTKQKASMAIKFLKQILKLEKESGSDWLPDSLRVDIGRLV